MKRKVVINILKARLAGKKEVAMVSAKSATASSYSLMCYLAIIEELSYCISLLEEKGESDEL